MTPRDDVSNSGSDLPQESSPDDPSSSVTLETVAIEESPQEVDEWAQSEGYTPLAAMAGGGAMFMMAMPPGDDDDGPTYSFQTSTQSAFFADMEAFETEEDAMPSSEAAIAPAQEEQDFRAIADQALKALDEEYTMTVRGVNVEKDKEITSEQNSSTSALASSDQSQTLKDVNGDQTNGDQTSGDQKLTEETVKDGEPKEDSKPRRLIVAPLPKMEPLPPPKEIDTQAVQKAFASIQMKHTKLSQRYEEWQQTLPPDQHPLIPSAPLSAFRKSTAKARQATANLSRSATVAHALHRLEILQTVKQLQPNNQHLVLHMLGIDRVETLTVEQIRITFGPLVRWLAASSLSPESVTMLLLGPNVVQQPPVDLMPKIAVNGPLKSATAICHLGAYHELDVLDKKSPPHLAVAFNAGVWGYEEWVPTLVTLKGVAPLIITAYTLEEAQDDADVLERELSTGADCSKALWTAEPNPFGSNMQRETKSIQTRVYRENAAWQAWGP